MLYRSKSCNIATTVKENNKALRGRQAPCVQSSKAADNITELNCCMTSSDTIANVSMPGIFFVVFFTL